MEFLALVSQLSLARLVVLATAAIIAVHATHQFIRDRLQKKSLPLPPGPTPLPLVGNALSFHPTKPWLTFTEWGAKYGNVIRARMFESDVIVLNSFAAAKDLLTTRSNIYSNRSFIATVEPFGISNALVFLQYGPELRLGRRIMHETYCANGSLAFRPMQVRRAREIVINIIDDAKEYSTYFKNFSASVALSAVYDYDAERHGDPMVKIIVDFVDKVWWEIISEKALILKFFPFLSTVPRWVPGLSWLSREIGVLKMMSGKLVEIPYQWAQKRMMAKEGISGKMVFDHIHRMEKMDDSKRAQYEKVLKYSAANSFFADTIMTSTTLMCFTDAMVKHPHVWRRAQQEIDAVVGTDRLPKFDDRQSLPFVDAIMRETYRWRPIAPFGVPHAAAADDVYNGYYIPSGTIVISNIWAMSRDESRYPDPDTFLPERFLDADGMLTDDDPADYVFGFGRRACPGRHLADASLWSVMTTMLATLDFNTVKDPYGNDVQFDKAPDFLPCNLTLRPHVTNEFLQSSL